MKNRRNLFIAAAAAAGLIVGTPLAAPSEHFKVFLCFGQSNMSGGNGVQPGSEEKKTHPRIKVLAFANCSNPSRTANQWADACEPMHCGDGMNTMGPSYVFGKAMADSLTNDTIGLIPCGLWGVSIEMFMEGKTNTSGNKPGMIGDNAWEWMLAKCKESVQRGVFSGIILHQGESNSGQTDWPGKVKSIYDDLKKELGFTVNVPIVAGELLYSGACFGHNTQVGRIPETFPGYGYVASAQGLSGVDQYHFNADGYRELGKRYAVEMVKGMRAANLITAIRPRHRLVSPVSVNSLQDNISVYTLSGKLISAGPAVSGAADRSMQPGNPYVVVNKATGISTKLIKTGNCFFPGSDSHSLKIM